MIRTDLHIAVLVPVGARAGSVNAPGGRCMEKATEQLSRAAGPASGSRSAGLTPCVTTGDVEMSSFVSSDLRPYRDVLYRAASHAAICRDLPSFHRVFHASPALATTWGTAALEGGIAKP